MQAGYLGGPRCTWRAHYGYDLGYGSYAKALLGDRQHWVRKLPGKLLHNIISHGIARIAEYLQGEEIQVIARGFVSPRLRALGESELIDELRVIIADGEQTTRTSRSRRRCDRRFTSFALYGARNGLILDEDKQTLIRLRGHRYTSLRRTVHPSADLHRGSTRATGRITCACSWLVTFIPSPA